VNNPAVQINLLPKDQFFQTALGRVLKWASTVGRFLIICTELVVILSFAARFKLDRELTDLNEQIIQKSAIVGSYGAIEEEVNAIHKKTTFMKAETEQLSPTEVLDLIAKRMPANTILSTTQAQPNTIVVTGNALSSNDFSQFIRALQLSPQVTNLNIDQIKSDEKRGTGFEFSIRIEAKK